MIITRTPYRVSLFGGSCDYKSFFQDNGAFLWGFGLNRYCFTSVMRLPELVDIDYQAFYSQAERVYHISEIKNPGIRGSLQYLYPKFEDFKKIAIFIQNELPSQTGIGSSSSLIVGLLNGLYNLYGVTPTKRQLADDAIYIERELLKEPGGIQDQIWASYSGLSSIEIFKDGNYVVKPLPLDEFQVEDFRQSSILFYTKIQRESFEIAKSHDKYQSVYKAQMQALARESYSSLIDGNLADVGFLMDESWKYKKQISPLISTEYIDSLYETIKKLGAWGCKLLGTGAGGFLYVMCPPSRKQHIIDNINLASLEVGFDRDGTKVIFDEKMRL